MAKRVMYSFTEKKHSKTGKFSTGMGILSLLIFIVLAVVSSLYRGNGGIFLGTIGVTGMIVSISGLILGLVSFGEEDKLYFFSKLGSVLNGMIMVGWISIMLLGF